MTDQFEYGKAFEKLFDDVRQSGVLSERERIIKLLEPYLDCDGCDGYVCSCNRSGFFIELIKGENK